MANKPKMINLERAERMVLSQGEHFAASVSRIGAQLGMKKMGCSLVELEPGGTDAV